MERRIWFCTDQPAFNEVNRLLEQGWVLDPDIYDGRPIRLENSVVYHLVKYEEGEEPVEAEGPAGKFDGVVSVRSVPLNEVDELLAEGYEVVELYAKTATLIKRKTEAEA